MSQGAIHKMWASYLAMVLPPDASLVQIAECKRAFYAGAMAYDSLLLTALDSGEDVSASEIAFVQSIKDELELFCQQEVTDLNPYPPQKGSLQ